MSQDSRTITIPEDQVKPFCCSSCGNEVAVRDILEFLRGDGWTRSVKVRHDPEAWDEPPPPGYENFESWVTEPEFSGTL